MRRLAALLLAASASQPSLAQDRGSVDPRPLPVLANPADPRLAAKQLFGRVTTPANLRPQAVGFYAHGCLAGGTALPVDGDAWQVMRVSRNRNWGTPTLVAFLEHFAERLPRVNGWPGILVGDMSQPRGGPMLNGHASHQVGLDADIWLAPMPDRRLSRAERETMMSTDVVRPDKLDVDPARWTPAHMALIEAAAEEPAVERIFVNPAIKKAICRDARGDRSWLAKVRPMFGHNYHFHIRLGCPEQDASCTSQPAVRDTDGCDATLASWFKPQVLHPRPNPNARPKPPLTLAGLPAECRRVLDAP